MIVRVAVAVAAVVGGAGVLVRVGGIGMIVRVEEIGVIVCEGGIFVAGRLVTVCGGSVTISVGLEHAAINEIIDKKHNNNQNGFLNMFPPFDLGIP